MLTTLPIFDWCDDPSGRCCVTTISPESGAPTRLIGQGHAAKIDRIEDALTAQALDLPQQRTHIRIGSVARLDNRQVSTGECWANGHC